MPPVTKAGGTQFRKDVEFVTKDDDEQVAAGIVMVPDKVDLQNDFAREETIRGFADQFEAFVEAGEAGGGIMHAVFPDGWMELERNEVLDEAEEIGDTEAPAGAWIQEWHIDESALWDLITDGILEGYSIGAIQVNWDGPYEQSEVDDVEVPDQIGDELVWELVDGIIREVSAVDIPAVPDAQILETKADAEKRLGDYLGDQDGFLEEAMERGHTEDEAERLWDLLNEAVSVEGSGEPGEKTLFRRIGKAAVDTFLGTDDDATSYTAATSDEDPRGRSDKEGRTLSQANRHSLYATIDSSLDILADAGEDGLPERFTDREDTEFDLSEHQARDWPKPDDEDDEDQGTDVSITDNATGGDTPDDNKNMSDSNDDPMDDAPEWAKELHEQQQENSKRIDEALGDEQKDADDDPLEDAPEWAKELHEQTEKNADRIDAISKQTGTDSQQLSGGDNGTDNGSKTAGFFIPESKRGEI